MNELIRVKNAAYGRYEELLLERDRLERLGESLSIAYAREFGELNAQIFEEKLACIRQKKAIAFCQTMINRGLLIDPAAMSRQLEREMALYQAQLKELLRENDEARKAVSRTEADLQRARKLYRRLAKKLHPDINPLTADTPALKQLWERIAAAYRCSDPIELAWLEILANRIIADLGLGVTEVEIPDIEARISQLEEEINELLTTPPVTYEDLLSDPAALEEKKAALRQELAEYRSYHEELNAALAKLLAEGGAGFLCHMN